MSIEMSLEIPLAHLKEFLNLTDFPFGLAHLCLSAYNPQAAEYAKLYRGCLLDNSMYELGDQPLSITDLLTAAVICDPTSVIAPDWMGERCRTIDGVEDLIAERPKGAHWNIGGVVQGRTLEDRVNCFYQLRDLGCRPLCFPFRTPREETIFTLAKRNAFSYTGWYHLLGLHSLSELYRIRLEGRWSYDTAKPFKGYYLDSVDDVRGLGRLDVHKPLTVEGRIAALWNIAYMRKVGGVKWTL